MLGGRTRVRLSGGGRYEGIFPHSLGPMPFWQLSTGKEFQKSIGSRKKLVSLTWFLFVLTKTECQKKAELQWHFVVRLSKLR